MTDKPEVRITKTLAAMARGAQLAGIERLCESQKTVACSVIARMVDEAQDINTGYALTFKYGHEAARAADKARIAELENERSEQWNMRRDAEGSLITAQAAAAQLREERDELLELLRDIKADLLRRAERDSDGCKVVNLGNGLWCRIDAALDQQGKEGET